MKTLRNFVDGHYVAAADGGSTELVNPSSGRVFATAPLSRAADVDAAYASSARAFDGWSQTTPADRQTALMRFADALEQRLPELVAAEIENTGKPAELMKHIEGPLSLNIPRFYSAAARVLDGSAVSEYSNHLTSMVRREPIGVCTSIIPFNYPLAFALSKTMAPVSQGNTVVLKPADHTPASALLVAEIAATVFPAGVINVICGDRETGRLLVAHKTPRHINVTGSVAAGMAIAADAARDLKQVVLELGGNAPVLIFEDANLAKAVECAIVSTFVNGGQDCTAGHRYLVHETLYEPFIAALKEALAGIRTGRPDEEGVFYGPIMTKAQFDRLCGIVDRRPSSSRLVTGGAPIDKGGGWFYPPTVVADVAQDDEIVQTEVFGPVLTVQKFRDEDEAVRLANGVPMGLFASLFTSHHGRALRVSRRLDFGTVVINTHHHVVSPDMPFGGFKHSGYGKDLSVYCAQEYTRVKHVASNWDA